MKYKCPVCQKTVKGLTQEKSEEAKFFPFCSQRCRLIDLGAWLDAEHKIISGFESQEPEDSSDTLPIFYNKQ